MYNKILLILRKNNSLHEMTSSVLGQQGEGQIIYIIVYSIKLTLTSLLHFRCENIMFKINHVFYMCAEKFVQTVCKSQRYNFISNMPA